MKFALVNITPPDGQTQEYVLGEEMVGEYAVEAVRTGSQFTALSLDALDAVILEPSLLYNKEIFLEACGLLHDEITLALTLDAIAGEDDPDEDEMGPECEGCPCNIDGQCVPLEYQGMMTADTEAEPEFAPIMHGEDYARARADYPFMT